MTATLEASPVQEKRRGNPNFGKKKEVSDERDFGIEIDPKKTYEFEALNKTAAFRTQSLSGICKIFDPIEQRQRVIRYIPQAESIFVDEQDENFTDRDAKTLYFTRDRLHINGTDKRGVEYCIMHDQYDGIKAEHRLNKRGAFFTLVDRDKHEKQLNDELKKETLAMKMIEDASLEELRPMARIQFNIIDTDELIVRNRLREYAKQPKKKEAEKSGATMIIESLKNPNLIRRYNIQMALDKGIVKIENNQGILVWGDTNNQINTVNPSLKPIQQVSELASYTFTKQGEEFYNLLKEKL